MSSNSTKASSKKKSQKSKKSEVEDASEIRLREMPTRWRAVRR